MTRIDPKDLTCKCGCGLNTVELELEELYARMLDAYGHPLRILSGVRCHRYNESLPGSPDSTHVPIGIFGGRALDLHAPTGEARFDLVHLAMDAGCKRVGIDPRGAIHVDVAVGAPWLFPRETCRLWTY